MLSAGKDEASAGKGAASLIWDDDPASREITDPRTPVFARAMIDALSEALRHAPGAMKRAFRTAAKSAAGLNVEPLQGLVEVIQNADDLDATEVRLPLRDGDEGRQLLIVHDGKPVTCQHVLAMVIPYFTTKEEERRGIGTARYGENGGARGGPRDVAAEVWVLEGRSNLARHWARIG
jgi:hypothetical protein